MDAKLRFHRHLQSLGIPIHGVGGAAGTDVRIDFQDEASDGHRAAAAAAAAGFDWSDEANAAADVQHRREIAKAEVASNAPAIIGRRADMLTIYYAIIGTRQRFNALVAKLAEKGTITEDEAAGLVAPLRALEEVIASRQAAIDAGSSEV